jgi:hypothetical protein
MSSVMLLIPRRVQLTEIDAHELISRLEGQASDRATANAISRIRFALTDNKEQTLTPSELPPSTPSSPHGSPKTPRPSQPPATASKNSNERPPRSEPVENRGTTFRPRLNGAKLGCDISET